MKSNYILTVIALVVIPWFGMAQGEYPRFESPIIQRPDTLLKDAFEVINGLIASKMGKPISAKIEPGPELQNWLKSNQKWMSEQVATAQRKLGWQEWPFVSALNRMPLPSVVANNGSGLVAGLDCSWSIHYLANDAAATSAMLYYAGLFQVVFDNDPNLAFELMNSRAATATASVTDILNLQVALGYWPGSKLQAPLSKNAWENLHRSANPVYRLIALEKFDSVQQSPAELLALYRECLFGACSYLEVRALEAIINSKDFREEVAKLLEEYIASNPPANDGTLPSLRNNFPNLIEGATRVIATIRNSDKSAASSSPQSDPFAQTTPATKPPPVVQPMAPKNAPTTSPVPSRPSEETTSSTPWSIIVGLIVAAIGLLWWLVKKRK